MKSFFKKKSKTGASQTPRKLEEIQKDYLSVSSQLGQKVYLVNRIQQEIGQLDQVMRALNHEADAAKALLSKSEKKLEVVKA